MKAIALGLPSLSVRPVLLKALPLLTLCLHVSPMWPKFSPAMKLARFLEFYAEIMEIDVWLSSTVVGHSYDESTKIWNVVIQRPEGQRTLKVHHIVSGSSPKY